jgi:undecaprenyl diphosphate synthase
VRELSARVQSGEVEAESIDEAALRGAMSTSFLPDVDLLIRTGGEKRISDFLLFEAAYAELAFLDVMWPEFDKSHLLAAIDHYRGVERRFGLTGEQAAAGLADEAQALARLALG